MPSVSSHAALRWTNLSNLSVLVTGGSGFVGANLLRELVRRGNRPTALLRPSSSTWRLRALDSDVRCLAVDVTDAGAVRRACHDAKPDVVIHAATYGAYGWQQDFDTIARVTLGGTRNVLDAASASGAKLFINLGSSSEYGPKSHPMAEADVPLPDRDYGLCKLAQTHLCRNFSSSAMRVVTLRLFNVYGPWEAPGRLVPNLLAAGLQGSRFAGSDPRVARDFVWVGDVCDVALEFQRLARCNESVLNVGTGTQTELGELVRIAEDALQSRIDVEWCADHRNDWDTTTWRADTTLSRRVLERVPQTELSDGIRSLTKWFRHNLRHYQSRDVARYK